LYKVISPVEKGRAAATYLVAMAAARFVNIDNSINGPNLDALP
jgi:hypothetical protein